VSYSERSDFWRRFKCFPELDLVVALLCDCNDLEAIVQDLLKSGVKRDCILEFAQLPTGCLLSRYQPAVLGSPKVRPSLASDTNDLMEYMSDKGSCHVLETPIDGEPKGTAILILTGQEEMNFCVLVT
jgi:hypothetical protein